MKIIFDLDYTLLDTKKLKVKLAELFNKENFLADYKKYFKDKNLNFNLTIYLSLLESQGRIDKRRGKDLKLKLRKLKKRLNNYLFTEIETILKRLKAEGDELILLTFGNKKWQAEKVDNLNIKNYFDKISFEDKDKTRSKLLKSLKNSRDEVLIVNDNIKEAKEMAEVIGKKARVFLVEGPYANNIEHNWPINKLNNLIHRHEQK